MSKFNIGDKVRFTGSDEPMGAQVGALAIVYDSERGYREIRGQPLVDVKWIRSPLSHTQSDGGYFEKEFVLVEPGPGGPW